MNDQISYKEAVEELEKISQQIESGETDIDELTALTKRAKKLIKICKKKLTQASEEIDQALKEIED